MSEFCLSKTFNICMKGMPLKKNGGRPKKASHIRRSKCVTSSYTECEYAQLSQKAKEANIPPSILQREASLKAKVIAQNYDVGLRLGILQEILKQEKYCRAELHKMERYLSEGRYIDSPPISPARLKELDAMAEKRMLLITQLMRQELKL